MGRIGKFAMRGVAALALATSAAAPATAMADETCKIEYLGGAEAMVVPDEDIFAQFGTMMPGDENSGIVDVRNSGEKPAKLWFWAEEETRTGGAGDDMLDEIVLEIVDMATGDSIYAGPLNPEGLAEPILLGTYEPGQSAELAYNLLVPGYLGNDYMDSSATVTWTFAAEEIVGSSGDKGGTHLADTSGANGSFFSKTGVDAMALLGLSGALVAVGAGGACVVGYRSRNNRG